MHDADDYGWTGLHHAAFDSYEDEGAAQIFEELLSFPWEAAWVHALPVCQQLARLLWKQQT